MSDAILYQSPIDSTTQRPVQQLSDLKVSGLCTTVAGANTDGGKLYGSFIQDGANYVLHLYSDVTKLDLVASATSTGMGIIYLTTENDSGITGTIKFITYSADDTAVEAIVLLTVDSDIPLANAEALSDFDADTGFAKYHEEAFAKIKEVVVSRYRSKLYDKEWVTASAINGGKGGFNLSKILNWSALKEAASHYVLYRLAERQAIDGNGIFQKKSEQSRNIYKAHLQSVEMEFDQNNERTYSESRPLSTWKISRGG